VTSSTIKINTCTREQADSLLRIQNNILQQLAAGAEHEDVLNALCKAAETLIPNAVASVMIFDPSHSFLEVIAAPSIPQQAIDRLNGLVPSPQAGSCGTAVYSDKPQYVCNTEMDQRWRSLQSFVSDFNIRACWSNPIRINGKRPVGSFALSSFEERQPSEFYKRLLETCAYIAGIVIKRQQEESQLWKLAHYDPLTNLPNRSFFNDHLAYALLIAKRTQKQLALLFLDLDKFKDINDSQGHEAGDRVLKYVAEKIQSCLRKSDIFARLGGDEFVILIENIDDIQRIDNICSKISQSFKPDFTFNHINYPLSVSIGISIYPDNGDCAQVLLRNADVAMYEAKKQGPGHFYYYQDQLTQNVTDRLQLISDIRQGLKLNEFIVYYQPQYCHKGADLIGAEALVRWQHPTKGLMSPAEFIPVAEQSGLINDLGIYVLTAACKQCNSWWQQGLQQFSLAINLSVNQLRPGFAAQLHQIIAEIDFPVNRLEMEVTESLIMKYDDLSELRAMEALGISISMDDFGTGHSSLAQLKHLPISKLKIDRSFVKDIPGDSNDMVIAKTIISMGHSLGLKIVAEGVETESQRDFLATEGCDILQGYLLSRPLPADQFKPLLKEQ